MIETRLGERAEEMLRESQRGFHTGNGCVDQIFMLRTMAENAREFNTSLYLAFVDVKKAYDYCRSTGRSCGKCWRKSIFYLASWYASSELCIKAQREW